MTFPLLFTLKTLILRFWYHVYPHETGKYANIGTLYQYSN